jgi:hypothetical protein
VTLQVGPPRQTSSRAQGPKDKPASASNPPPFSRLRGVPHGQGDFRYGDGHLREVLDNQLGIKVDWVPVLYTNEFSVTMLIFRPRA